MKPYIKSPIRLLRAGIAILGMPAFLSSAHGGEIIGTPPPFTPFRTILIGASPESSQEVLRLQDTAVETCRFEIPEADGSGGSRVATGDFNGDGIPDGVVAAGPGSGSRVAVFSGADGTLLRSFIAYDPGFRGGVYVAAGDIDGDGTTEIITGSGAGGGPHVKVFKGTDNSEILSFDAYPTSFTGGVRVAAGDVNGDGKADIITGAGASAGGGGGAGPHVKVFNGITGSEIRSFFAFSPTFAGGVYVGAGQIDGETGDDIVVGGSDGTGPHVRVFDGQRSGQLFDFAPFPGPANGGVRVAVGDIDGDGLTEIITTPDDERNFVRVFDRTGSPESGFTPDIASRQGGVFVAAGTSPQNDSIFVVGNGAGGSPGATMFEISKGSLLTTPVFSGTPQGISVAMSDHTGDSIPDIIVGSGGGVESRVSVFDGNQGGIFGGFRPYDPAFTGGITVAAADFDGDGHSELITAPGPGSPQEVRVFDGRTVGVVHSLFPFGSEFQGGVRVAAGDLNGDGTPDIIVGAGADAGGPHVKVFDGLTSNELHSFFAYGESFAGGVSVAAGDVNGDGKADIITAPDSSMGPLVKVFDGKTGAELAAFFAFDPRFRGGVHVAAGDVTGDGADNIVVSPVNGGEGEYRVFGNAGADLIAVVPGFSEAGFPIAVADRPTSGVAISNFRLAPGGVPTVEVRGTRGLFLHLESGADLRIWNTVGTAQSDGTPVTMDDDLGIGQDAWFVRGRAR